MSDETKPTTEAPPAAAVEKKEEEPKTEDAVMSGALDADTKTNGDEASKAEEKPAETTTEAPAATESEDKMEVDDKATEEKVEETAPETAAAAEDAEADTATPASAKKANGKRKSFSGVPEHKTKKLNKKKSAAKLLNLDAKPGEYYLARFKGYAPWPSIICDEEMLPAQLLNSRPVTTKQVDGTYREPYADGGKKVNERTFPVMFLYTNEFCWLINSELTPLDPADCKDVPEKGKNKQLIEAYKVAAEGHDIEHFKNLLMEHERALQQDIEAKEEAARAKAEKAEKKTKRKSMDAARDVEMEDAGSADETSKSASKKRKKSAAESDGEAPEKAAKTPKTSKLKLTGPKTPASEKKAAATPKEKKPRSTKKKAASEEEVEPAKEEKPITPEEAKAKREKEILYLRHRLQKGFLSRDQAPKEEEMDQMSSHIKRLEEQEDLEVSIIRTTKINKVLKAINKLATIPREHEFNIRARSLALLTKWNKILGTSESKEGKAEKTDKAATNGVEKNGEETEKATASGEEADAAETEAPKETEEKAAESATEEKKDAEVEKPADEAKEETKTEEKADAETEKKDE